MAKDTNSLKCLGTVSGCDRIGSVVSVKRFLTNYGFILHYDVTLSGFELTKSQLMALSYSVRSLIKRSVKEYGITNFMESEQLELF